MCNKVFNHVGQMVVEPLFQLRTDQAAQDNGDNRGSIAGSRENNRDAEKGGVEAHFKSSPG